MYTTEEIIKLCGANNVTEAMEKLDVTFKNNTYFVSDKSYDNLQAAFNYAIVIKDLIPPEDKKIIEEENAKVQNIILTTGHTVDGYKVTKHIDIIGSECVFGMNLFKDIFAGLSDVFGGRNKSTQKILKDAKEVCLKELKKEALDLGANAVIAIDLDYSEFSGGGKSMLFLVATGTAVTIEAL